MIDEVAAQKDVTIFAPRNAAFQQLAGTFAVMDKATLQRTLRYHLVPNHLTQVWELKNASTLTAAAARAPPLLVTRHANAIYVNAAEIIQSGILIANGVVHILDNVLNPAVNSSRPDVTRTAAQPPVFRATGATETGTTVPTPFTSYLPCTASCPVTSETATTTETTSRGTASAAATGKSSNAGVVAARCTGLVRAGVGVGLVVGAMVVGL
ncbi:FAS1 domain-containing protein [Staphylotrichum tortipilum]|uniref:FAS1 domain-containing protein n=1 Tax=Staphylotrichum tortipilum TaxID=2831512 RepID=A0AAN6MBH6_9PEZI|nr:FAS1 domain-containing protein [Staphylotrichum longicolle]